MKKQTPTINRLLCFLLLLNAITAKTQSYHTLLSTGYAYGHGDKNKAVENYFLKASLPLKLKNGNYLVVNTDFHRQSFYFDTVPVRTAFKTGLIVGYLKMLKDGKGSILSLLNFSNNFEEGTFGIESMQIGAGILVTKKRNEHFKLKYGIYLNQDRFGILVVPLLGLDYKINDRMRLFGAFPQSMKFEMKYKNRLRYGALFEAPVNSYRVRDNKGWGYLDQRQVNFGLFGDFYISKKAVLQLAVKQPVYNTNKIFANNETYTMSILGVGVGGTRNSETVPQAYVKYTTLFEFSLQYRIEKDDK